MITFATLLTLTLSLPVSNSLVLESRADNDGIHLAVSPACGAVSGGKAVDHNNGVPALNHFKTIVVFGDSYTTDGKKDGSTPAAPVLVGDSPKAGGRTTNGLTWVEDIAADAQAKIMDYAVGGAVVNVTLWPSKSTASDFISQSNIFLSQNNNLDPETTLYTSFFGINDYSASSKDGNHLPQAAADYVALVQKLAGPPTNAKYWLALDAYGRGSSSAAGDAYKNAVFNGLAKTKLKWAFVDFKTLWDAVLKSPSSFGYVSTGACTVDSSTVQGACSDPAHTFYWIPGHPSKQTHRIMADYAEKVLQTCV